MNNTWKYAASLLLAAMIAVSPVAAQTTDIADLQKAADDLAETFAKALPFNSTVGLNWSDAYIKKFPHFGVGLVGGVTTIDAGEIASVMEKMGYDDVGDIPDVLPLPAAAFEGRLGGFVWPFDIGFKIGFIPESIGDGMSDSGLALDYFLVGFDVRYALLEGKGFMPKLSVGGGFNYLKGGVSATADGGQDYTFTYNPGTGDETHTISVTDPEVGLEWKTTVIDLKAQASWKFLIFTPYVGLGLSHGWSSAGYFIDSDVTYDGNELTDAQLAALLADLREYNDYLEQSGQGGFDIPNVSSTGIDSSVDVTGFAMRTFGGLSITPFPFVRFDLTGLYNFFDGAYGGSLGIRIQF